jgi:hypothetical protein
MHGLFSRVLRTMLSVLMTHMRDCREFDIGRVYVKPTGQ